MDPRDEPSNDSACTLQSTVFAVLWAVTLLYDRLVRGMAVDPWSLAVVVAAIAVLLRPSVGRLVTLVIVHLVWFAFHAPYALYIHWFLAAFVDVVILAAAVGARLRGPLTHADLVSTMAPAARWVLLIALSSVGFAKLNTSFLNPETSCAAALFEFQRVTLPFSMLPDAPWTKQAAVYLTLAAELGVPLFLCFRRTRTFAMLLAAGFFLLIGTNPQAKLYEFSSIFLSLMLLFVPAELLIDIRERLRAHPARARLRELRERSGWQWSRAVATAVLVYLVAYMVSYSDDELLAREHRFVLGRLSYAIGLPLLIGLYAWGRLTSTATERPTRSLLLSGPRWMLVLPLVFFMHEASTYLGFKRVPTLTMAANLQMARGHSNHIVVREVPAFESNRVVTLVRSNDPLLDGKGRRGITWAGFRDYLARHPETRVTFELDGVRETVARAGDDARFARPSFWEAVSSRAGDRHPHGIPYTFPLLTGDKRCHHRVGPWLEKEERAKKQRARRRKELRKRGIYLP